MKKVLIVLLCTVVCLSGVAIAAEVDFEDLTLNPDSYYNGSDKAGGFTSGEASFNNFFDDTYGAYWEGFAYSNTTDTTTLDFTNYSAVAGSGAGGSVIYGVGYQGFMGSVPTITLGASGKLKNCYITNTTYAYLTMRDGYSPAKKFGGESGTDADWFLLTITGKDADGNTTGTVEFYLSDFRSDDSADDYIIDEWTQVDLSGLGEVKSLEFTLASTDNGDYGMNTPAYFAIDDINFEDDDDDDDLGCFIGASGLGAR